MERPLFGMCGYPGLLLARVPAGTPHRFRLLALFFRQACRRWLAQVSYLSEVAIVSRQRKRRSGRTVRWGGPWTTVDRADPVWLDVGSRRIFVVGWTSGGAPYGVFEDEMDAVMNDLDADVRDQPY